MVRDLMLETVEKRFGATSSTAYRRVAVRQRQSLHRSRDARLRRCSGPGAMLHAGPSPQSNGIAEAFVKTFKRDHARVHPLPDAATVLRQLAEVR